jgi:hypothetical protein
MPRKILPALAYIVTVVAFVPTAIYAQSMSDPLKACETRTANYSAWVNCVTEIVVRVATLEANQRHPSKQVELPSIADNTTSLVDQTSAPDLAGLALNFAGLKSKTDSTDSNDNGASGTITTSAYALYAVATKNDALDPAFYYAHPDLRRFSFTVGRDGGDDDLGNGSATILGFKALLVNGREIVRNRRRLDAIAQALSPAGPIFAIIENDLTNYLFGELGTTLNNCNQPAPAGSPTIQFSRTCLAGAALTTTVTRLTPKQREQIFEIVANRAITTASPLLKLNETTADVIGRIRRAPQLSFTFQSKLRNEDGKDEYRTGLLFDYGVWDRFNVSLNGTFDYADSKVIGGDTRAGRFAAEGIFQLTPNESSLGDPRPLLLSTSAEAKWANNDKSTYTGQLKLTIPIPGLTGVNFPISVSLANRSDLIDEKVVRGKFGFTIDITKLLTNAP